MRCFMTTSLSAKRKSAISKYRFGKEASHADRTYREELYAGRTINASRMPVGVALSRVFDVVRREGILASVQRKREWVRPGFAASMAAMKQRHKRFKQKVCESIEEVKEIYRRLE